MPDGKMVVSAGLDLTVRGWNPDTGKEAWRTLSPTTHHRDLPLPKGSSCKNRSLARWDQARSWTRRPARNDRCPERSGSASTKPMIAALGQPVADALLAMSPDGKSIVTLAFHASAFRVWSWPDGRLQAAMPIAPPGKLAISRCSSASFTKDGKQFVAVMQYHKINNEFDSGRLHDPTFVERWDLAAGKMLARQDGGTNNSPPKLIPYSGGVLVLGNGPELRDAVTGATFTKLSVPDGQADDFQWARTATLSPDERVLAIGNGWSSKVWLFEMRTGKLRQSLLPDGRYRGDLRFLSDGRLVSASDTALVWSVGLRSMADSTEDLATMWGKLSDPDPKIAWQAMASLAGRGTTGVEFIRQRIPIVPRIREGTIDRIVKALDAARFTEREAASAELDRLGSAAVAHVKARLNRGVPAEARTRIDRFLAKYDRVKLQPNELQYLRGIEVLEAIGAVESKKALQAIAAGEPGARTTRDAAQALRRTVSK